MSKFPSGVNKDGFDVDEHRKFLQLSTGVDSVDKQVKAVFGNWLTPSEERSCLIREIRKSPEDPLQGAWRQRLEALQGVTNPEPIKPLWEVKISKIPFQNQFDELCFMKLRQLFIWSNPVTDSGCYRLTYREGKFSCIDAKTNKSLGAIADLDDWLRHFFEPNEIREINWRLYE